MLIRQQPTSKPQAHLFLREMPILSDAVGDKYVSTLISRMFHALRLWAFPSFCLPHFRTRAKSVDPLYVVCLGVHRPIDEQEFD